MKRQDKLERLKTALKELGGGKNKVAQSLRSKKIKGERGGYCTCPIAVFIDQKVFPKKCESVYVNGDWASVVFKNGEVLGAELPKAVASFINEFDSDDIKYKFLEEKHDP
jgi:hypothetical protein